MSLSLIVSRKSSMRSAIRQSWRDRSSTSPMKAPSGSLSKVFWPADIVSTRWSTRWVDTPAESSSGKQKGVVFERMLTLASENRATHFAARPYR